MGKQWKQWQTFFRGAPKSLQMVIVAMKSVHSDSEGDQPWDFFGKNDAEAETPVLWPPHEKS